jgi:hypothetical protein
MIQNFSNTWLRWRSSISVTWRKLQLSDRTLLIYRFLHCNEYQIWMFNTDKYQIWISLSKQELEQLLCYRKLSTVTTVHSTLEITSELDIFNSSLHFSHMLERTVMLWEYIKLLGMYDKSIPLYRHLHYGMFIIHLIHFLAYITYLLNDILVSLESDCYVFWYLKTSILWI